MTRRTIALSYSLLAALPLAACGPDAGGDAVFADASQEQLARIAAAAIGMDVFAANLTAGSYVLLTGLEACPRVTQAGNVHTITGGCDTDEGGRIEGSIVATNLASPFDAPNPALVTEIAFSAFSVTDPDGSVDSFDGTLAYQPEAFQRAALTTALDTGAPVTLDAEYQISGAIQEALAGAAVSLEGLGTANFSSRVDWQNGTVGLVELIGADTLRLDITQTVDDCTPYTIDGVLAGELCNDHAE